MILESIQIQILKGEVSWEEKFLFFFFFGNETLSSKHLIENNENSGRVLNSISNLPTLDQIDFNITVLFVITLVLSVSSSFFVFNSFFYLLLRYISLHILKQQYYISRIHQ